MTISKPLTTFLPVLLIVIVAVVAFWALHDINRQAARAETDSSVQYVSDAELQECLGNLLPDDKPITATAIKNCVKQATKTTHSLDEAIKPRIEELKWLLSIIAGLGAFFALAQGAATYASAQTYTKQAEDKLKDIAQQQEKIQERYPIFGYVAEVRKRAYKYLDDAWEADSKSSEPQTWASINEALDSSDNFYRRLGTEARQEILSVESFTSMDLEPIPYTPADQERLRRLAHFYRSKFLFEKQLGFASFSDLERAEIYLVLASSSNRDFIFVNDLGSVYNTIALVLQDKSKDAAEGYFSQAEQAFSRSVRIERRQQRAYNGLGVLLARQMKYREAIAEVEKGLKFDVWQREPLDHMKSMLLYNMACYQSRVLLQTRSAKDTTHVTLQEAGKVIEYLQATANLKSFRRKVIERDFENDKGPWQEQGDFLVLRQKADAELASALDDWKAKLLEGSDKN